jgi:uncharacterized protein
VKRNLHQSKAFPGLTLCILAGMLGIPGLMITHVTPQRSEAVLTPKTIITVIALLALLAFLWLSIQLLRRSNSLILKAKTLTVALVATLAGSYLVLILFVALFQDQFIAGNSIIFQPRAMPQQAAQPLVAENIEALTIVTADHIRLTGWLVKNVSQGRSPLIIYFGGSSQEVSTMIPYFQRIDGWSTALVNYRGYGLSEGSPSEESFFQDAILLYETLSKREDIDSTKIVAMGWSLGTGVAVYLSAQRQVSGTILVSPFDNWAHMFQSRDFPLIPLTLIHKEYLIFNSIQRAPTIHNPLLCLVGVKDTVVLPRLSKSLVNYWAGEATMNSYQTAGHGLLFQENTSWEDIAEFLEALE